MSETWKPRRQEVHYVVDLAPATNYLVHTRDRAARERGLAVTITGAEYPIGQVTITYYGTGNEWGKPLVLLQTAEPHGRVGRLYLDQLRARPAWLVDILNATDALMESEVRA